MYIIDVKESERWLQYRDNRNTTAHDGSDLDLVVKSENTVKWSEFLEFRDALLDSSIPILVEVLLWDKINESFRKNILSNYEVIYKRA